MSSPLGLITDTISFSNVDGPGNRFVVFLQGCNFNCIACHNPYTIDVCSECGDCVVACPSGALSITDAGGMAWDDTVCAGTEACIAVCPYDSTPKARRRTVDEVLVSIRRAAPFLSGVTVSGGEATLQPEFVTALFAAVKADPVLRHLTCFVDSNGSADRATWDALAPVMDGAMIDLKCIDDGIHRSMTGQSNVAVLDSIRHLHALGRLYEVRLLLVPGVNDDPLLLARTALWLAEVDPHLRVVLIGFRAHGVRPHVPALLESTAAARDRAAAVFAAAGVLELCVV